MLKGMELSDLQDIVRRVLRNVQYPGWMVGRRAYSKVQTVNRKEAIMHLYFPTIIEAYDRAAVRALADGMPPPAEEFDSQLMRLFNREHDLWNAKR